MKNAKKILLVLLAIVALTLVLSISIFAEEPTYKADTVAVVNGVEYNSFDAAYNATPAGGTLKLVKGVSMVTKTFDKAITLDFNGQTMTFTNSHGGISLKHSGVVFTSTAATRGKIVYTGRVAAIRCWNADKIENVDIECTYDYTKSTNGTKTIGGIVMQNQPSVRINTIQNVDMYGVGLTNGIETYNCGNATQDVIGYMYNVKITATNNSNADAFGMKICAPVGTVENCEIYGEDAGIFLWNKDDTYVSTVTLENCEVSGNDTAIEIQIQGCGKGTTLNADAATAEKLSSTSGATFTNTSYGAVDYSEDLTFVVPGYAMDASGSVATCTDHTWADATCTSPKTCSKCKATEGKALPHTYEVTEKVEAKPGVEGKVTYTCSGCDATYSETIEALPEHTHTPVEIPEVLPTPSKVGYTAGVKCSECGDVLEAPVEIPALGIDPKYAIKSAALNLGDCLNMIYKTSVPAGYANPYMVFVFNGQETTVTEYTVETGTGYYCFKFPGITPLYMGENIHATLYANVNGEEVSKVIPNFGVKTYCQQMMTLNKNDAAMITLISDLLTYGAQAQLYFNINTDNLITSGLTLKPSTFATLDSSYNKMALKGTADGMVTWTSATLNLGNTTNMIFKFKATDIEGLEIKVTINGRTQYLDVSEMKATGGVYEAKFTNITALEFNDVVTATAVKNGVESTQYVTFSINSYVYSCQSYTGTDSDMLALVALNKAMYNYGASAAAYFKK